MTCGEAAAASPSPPAHRSPAQPSPSPCVIFNADLAVTGACSGSFPCGEVAVGVGYFFGDILSFAKTVFVAVFPTTAGEGSSGEVVTSGLLNCCHKGSISHLQVEYQHPNRPVPVGGRKIRERNNTTMWDFYPERIGCILHQQRHALRYPLGFAPLPSLVIFSTALYIGTVWFRQFPAVFVCLVVLNPWCSFGSPFPVYSAVC